MYPALLLHFLVGQLRQIVAIGRSVIGALLNLPLQLAAVLQPVSLNRQPITNYNIMYILVRIYQ